MLERARNKKIFGMLIGAAVLLAFASPASAKPHASCKKSGLSTLYANDEGVFLTRDVHTKVWESGSQHYYVCSNAFHKRVDLGIYGMSSDGPSWIETWEVNRRYAAVVIGAAGNATSDDDTSVWVVDLKTGKTHFDDAPTTGSYGGQVGALVLKWNGAVAWITTIDDGAPAITNEVHVHDGSGSRIVASGTNIVSSYLEFGRNSGSVIWATETASTPVD